jgi:hypothetical protein
LELDYTASAIDIGISNHSMDNQQKKEHLMKSGIVKVGNRFKMLKYGAHA